MAPPTRAPFRLRPPELPDGLVVRDRLLDELRGRFERRLTVVRAGPGFGKTTVLAHAVADNALDPEGVDVWLQLVEQDRRPEHLLSGVAASLVNAGVVAVEPGDDPSVDEIVDWIWAVAPRPVALVFDDVHVIDASPSIAVLADLCERLSANGHLVVGTRTTPAIPVRLLQARGQASVVDEADLAFTAGERSMFARLRHDDDETGVPSWPALAVLMSSVGRSASIEFLWEAVLGSLDPDRRRALALLVEFERIDDQLVEVVVGDQWTAGSLTTALPLIEARDGDHRFHDLWREALEGSVTRAERDAALAAGAELLAQRGETARAARCFRSAGADDQLIQLAREFGASPISAGLSATVADALIECLPRDARNGALGRYLRVIASTTFQGPHVLGELRSIYRLAEHDGDDELAALALWRETQLVGDVDPADLSGPEYVELFDAVERYAAAGNPTARSALALIRSHEAEQRGDVAAALAAVDMFEGPVPAAAQASATSRFLALGHPERVTARLEDVLAEGVSEPVSAQAVWWRGDIDPTPAWSIAAELPAAYSPRNLPSVQVPLLGVLATVALAAGDVDGARRAADQAVEMGLRLLDRPRLFASVADALVVLAADGDDSAIERFDAMLSTVPLEPWPAWAYLGSLCAIRALIPGTGWLDDIEFGPALRTAVAAGRAVATLRSEGDVGPSLALPWQSAVLLRVQVPPSLLCELALAARDHPAAGICLGQIPRSDRWVRRLVDHPQPDVAATARRLTAGTAGPPGYRLSIDTLGQFTIRRSDGVSVSDRVRGGRVHQLVAHLLLDRSPRRAAVAAQLWPDLDDAKAGANLRVTLNTLLEAIEPDRRPGTSWFIRTDDGRLELGDEDVDVDVRRFDAHVSAARDAERSGRLTVALEQHRAAFALYRGEFLPGVVDAEVEHERLRLQTLAYNSGCRIGELLLAKGEPEEALRTVLDAMSIDPHSERARRAELRCHLALGSTLAARACAQRLRADLRDEGVRPDRETAALLERADPERPTEPDPPA